MLFGTLSLALCSGELAAGEFKLNGFAAAETQFFLQDAQFPHQHGTDGSLVLQPEFYWESSDTQQSVLFTPFLRVDDGDASRTHGDIRELTWVKAASTWELRAGIRKVFWGVAESNHLVDIINQTDLVEDIDGEDKLGQPMLNLAIIQPWGTVDLFMLPGFRTRTFPGKSGRLRTQLRVDTSSARYESAAQDRHVDWAIRYANSFGDIDLGVYHFWGTGREPELLRGLTAAGEPVLIPRYDVINQTGVDLQATRGNWLWKLEALRRTGQGAPFAALVAGFEYTLVGVLGSPGDLGLLSEYHFDERGEQAVTPFNNDLFVGTRWALNDTMDSQILAGVITDLDGRGRFFNVEASRRLDDRWKLELELRMFWDVARSDPLRAIVDDDYLQLALARYF